MPGWFHRLSAASYLAMACCSSERSKNSVPSTNRSRARACASTLTPTAHGRASPTVGRFDAGARLALGELLSRVPSSGDVGLGDASPTAGCESLAAGCANTSAESEIQQANVTILSRRLNVVVRSPIIV